MLVTVIEWFLRWRDNGYREIWNNLYGPDGYLVRYMDLVNSIPKFTADARRRERAHIVKNVSRFLSDPDANVAWTHTDLVQFIKSIPDEEMK